MLDTMLARLAANDRTAHLLIPLLRGYIRYGPSPIGKRKLWTRVVQPYFAWESHKFVARTIFGSELVGDTVEILQQYVYYFGVWEPHITRWISQRLKPGDVFIDVGANIGYYTLLGASIVGASGTVVAIEASPKTFSHLQTNLARNRARNVRAVNAAAAETEGSVKLFRGPATHIGLATIFEEEGLRQECEFECEVRSAPLTALLQPDEIQRARVIKIDVEGAERAVVAGMAPLLNSGRKDLEITVEIGPERLARQGRRAQDILDVFRDAGFHAYRLENDYSALGHLPGRSYKRPARIRGPIESEVDVLFSRQDMEIL
jgi:FkbM family methyltransferase